jgi:putative transposase
LTRDPRDDTALWRYQIIAPLLSLDGRRGELRLAIRRLASRPHAHPTKGTLRLGFGTIEGWYYRYRREGLPGLVPVPRKDRGKSRRIDGALAEHIDQIATEHPDLDGRQILAELRSRLGEDAGVPSLSSLYRFLRSSGLDQRRQPTRADHRAFAFDLAGDCWQSDVMYGPSLPVREGVRRKTFLLAILDDASRLIPHAQFYFEQHLRSFKDCLKQAFLKRGLPRRLYLDNAQIFRSRSVLHLAAHLGIQILHTRPYRPQGRAKIERFFGTVRRSFLRRIEVKGVLDLDALNRQLFAFIEGEYHRSPHRGLKGETPLDAWLRLAGGVRPLPGDADLDLLFLEEARRRVAKDGTFALLGRTFEAGPEFIGQRLAVRFDPYDLRRVFLVTGEGRLHAAFPVDLSGNRRVRRKPHGEDQGGGQKEGAGA